MKIRIGNAEFSLTNIDVTHDFRLDVDMASIRFPVDTDLAAVRDAIAANTANVYEVIDDNSTVIKDLTGFKAEKLTEFYKDQETIIALNLTKE